MARTTGDEVREILDTDLTDAQLEPFITTANLIVTEHLAGDSATTSTKLTLIERWLAAHFACVLEKQTKSETAGAVSASYQGQQGMRLEATHYGQNAMLLDDTGALAALNAQEKRNITPSIASIHKTPDTW